MPSIDTATENFTIDERSNTLRFVRKLAATPSRVFQAWTDPGEIALWWDPTGQPLGECEIDLRPGGSFRFVTQHHPDAAFTGVYREVSPPDRLAFDANGAVGTVALDGSDGGTQMTVEIVCSSAEHLRQFVAMGVADGTSRTLDNLPAYLVAQRR